MKTIIQAAGYGTRLLTEVQALDSNPFATVTKKDIGVAKALIPIQGKPVVQHHIEQLQQINVPLDDIFIVTNQVFFPLFIDWAEKFGFPVENIINNGTTSNEGRLGSNGDILLTIEQKKLFDDLLILAGDTLYVNTDFGQFIKQGQTAKHGLVAYYHEPSEEKMKSKGNLIIEGDRLADFIEKPDPPVSQLAFPSLNYLKSSIFRLLPHFLEEVQSLSKNDGHGFFLQWLLKEEFVLNAVQIPGRFDLGTLEDCQKAEKEYQP